MGPALGFCQGGGKEGGWEVIIKRIFRSSIPYICPFSPSSIQLE